MKKLLNLLMFMALSLIATIVISEAKEKSLEGVKVGMAVQDLSNPTWAGYCQAIQKAIEARGGNMNFVSCESNITKQINQIENFVASGVNVLIVHPADPAGVEESLKQARAKGIKVIAWDDNLENADLAWLIDNHKLGYTIGESAAKWINEKLGGKAEVAILNYPQLPILLERGNGIKDAITKLAPNAKIVAEVATLTPGQGMTNMETIFQAHPNVKVVGATGSGGSIGANEAAKAGQKITPDFGIFAADATQPELIAMQNDEGVRMSVTITGTNKEIAETVSDMVEQVASGKPVEKKEVFRELIPVTKDNLDKYLGQ